MASSDVSSVVNYFPYPNEGFTTTLGSTISSGASSVPLNATSGLTNGQIFVGIIEPGGTNQQVFTGTVDVAGSQITSVVWTRGTNVGHAGGVTIVDYVTGTALKMITAGILKDHVQIGGHSVLHDVNNNIWIDQGATAAAVNHIKVANSAANNSPVISTTGNDSNIDITFTPKGTGQLKGVVDHLYNPCKFNVINTGNAGLLTQFAWTLIPMQSKLVDTGSNFSTSTNLFTAPYTGNYSLSATITFNNGANNGAIALQLCKNGAPNTGTTIIANNGVCGSSQQNTTLVASIHEVQLTQNDTIGVYGFNNILGMGVAGTAANFYSGFNGFFISAT